MFVRTDLVSVTTLTLEGEENEDPPLEEHLADGGKVYLIGTAHFSHESQRDVSQVLRTTILSDTWSSLIFDAP